MQFDGLPGTGIDIESTASDELEALDAVLDRVQYPAESRFHIVDVSCAILFAVELTGGANGNCIFCHFSAIKRLARNNRLFIALLHQIQR